MDFYRKTNNSPIKIAATTVYARRDEIILSVFTPYYKRHTDPLTLSAGVDHYAFLIVINS